MIVRAKNPPIEYKKTLKEPYDIGFVGISCLVHEHYFCEGQGVTENGISQESAYDSWLESFRNPWWKRLFGASLYSIDTIEFPEPSIYQGEA